MLVHVRWLLAQPGVPVLHTLVNVWCRSVPIRHTRQHLTRWLSLHPQNFPSAREQPPILKPAPTDAADATSALESGRAYQQISQSAASTVTLEHDAGATLDVRAVDDVFAATRALLDSVARGGMPASAVDDASVQHAELLSMLMQQLLGSSLASTEAAVYLLRLLASSLFLLRARCLAHGTANAELDAMIQSIASHCIDSVDAALDACRPLLDTALTSVDLLVCVACLAHDVQVILPSWPRLAVALIEAVDRRALHTEMATLPCTAPPGHASNDDIQQYAARLRAKTRDVRIDALDADVPPAGLARSRPRSLRGASVHESASSTTSTRDIGVLPPHALPGAIAALTRIHSRAMSHPSGAACTHACADALLHVCDAAVAYMLKGRTDAGIEVAALTAAAVRGGVHHLGLITAVSHRLHARVHARLGVYDGAAAQLGMLALAHGEDMDLWRTLIQLDQRGSLAEYDRTAAMHAVWAQEATAGSDASLHDRTFSPPAGSVRRDGDAIGRHVAVTHLRAHASPDMRALARGWAATPTQSCSGITIDMNAAAAPSLDDIQVALQAACAVDPSLDPIMEESHVYVAALHALVTHILRAHANSHAASLARVVEEMQQLCVWTGMHAMTHAHTRTFMRVLAPPPASSLGAHVPVIPVCITHVDTRTQRSSHMACDITLPSQSVTLSSHVRVNGRSHEHMRVPALGVLWRAHIMRACGVEVVQVPSDMLLPADASSGRDAVMQSLVFWRRMAALTRPAEL